MKRKEYREILNSYVCSCKDTTVREIFSLFDIISIPIIGSIAWWSFKLKMRFFMSKDRFKEKCALKNGEEK